MVAYSDRPSGPLKLTSRHVTLIVYAPMIFPFNGRVISGILPLYRTDVTFASTMLIMSAWYVAETFAEFDFRPSA